MDFKEKLNKGQILGLLIISVGVIIALATCKDTSKDSNKSGLAVPSIPEKIKTEKEHIASACPNGVNSESSLTKKNIVHKEKSEDGSESESFQMQTVDTKDKCFKILHSKFVYLFDEKHAMYEVYIDNVFPFFKPLLFIDFVNSSAKYNTFSGIVKGVGLFEYKDGRGIPRTVPYMIVIQEYRKRE